MKHLTLLLFVAVSPAVLRAADQKPGYLYSTAYALPKQTTSEGSGYFSIVEGHNERLYIGTAKYGSNAYLVEFDPKSKTMKIVVDAQKEIGNGAKGFAAQAKFHTRNNVGKSGKIYFGTKQGYPKKGERRTDYKGGYPMVYDPKTGKTRVYDIPVRYQGIISIAPDESRGVAYISTCSDERPVDSTYFVVLDLKSGKYRRLLDCRHMYAFIVVDYKHRAYHPVLGGGIARYTPSTVGAGLRSGPAKKGKQPDPLNGGRLDLLRQTIDGAPPGRKTLLATEQGHPINWDISPDRKMLYAVAMSGNQLYGYDLTSVGPVLKGRSLGPLIAGALKTDCRAMCVGPDGTVWAGVAATFPGKGQLLHLVSYRPGAKSPTDHGPIAIRNPDYTTFTGKDGKPLPWHHGVAKRKDGVTVPRYVIMGICAAKDGTVYVTTLYPLTLHALKPRRKGAN